MAVDIQFKVGSQTQTIKLEGGENINISPSANGSAVTISVTPDPSWGGGETYEEATTAKAGLIKPLSGNANQFYAGNGQWKTPDAAQRVSANQDGLCPGLPTGADASKYALKGNGEWGEVPDAPQVVSAAKQGLCPALPANDSIFTQDKWKRYRVYEQVMIMVENANNLTLNTDYTLSFNEASEINTTMGIASDRYSCLSVPNTSHKCKVYVHESLISSLGTKQLVFNFRRGNADSKEVYSMCMGIKNGSTFTPWVNQLANMCPNPFVDVKNDWHTHGDLCGWANLPYFINDRSNGKTTLAGPYTSALLWDPMGATAMDNKWLLWGVGYSGKGAAKDNRLVFHRPAIQFYD